MIANHPFISLSQGTTDRPPCRKQDRARNDGREIQPPAVQAQAEARLEMAWCVKCSLSGVFFFRWSFVLFSSHPLAGDFPSVDVMGFLALPLAFLRRKADPFTAGGE